MKEDIVDPQLAFPCPGGRIDCLEEERTGFSLGKGGLGWLVAMNLVLFGLLLYLLYRGMSTYKIAGF